MYVGLGVPALMGLSLKNIMQQVMICLKNEACEPLNKDIRCYSHFQKQFHHTWLRYK